VDQLANSCELVTTVQPSQVAQLFDGHIGEVVGYVFLTMMELTVRAAAKRHEPSSDVVAAIVEFNTTWHGALALELGRGQAVRFTQLLLGSDSADLAAEEIQDAVGEIVNIIAGNIKFFLPAGVGLGLPSLIQEQAYFPRMLGRRPLGCRSFDSNAGPFSVVLLEGA
jgi:hypothetical protein